MLRNVDGEMKTEIHSSPYRKIKPEEFRDTRISVRTTVAREGLGGAGRLVRVKRA